MEIGIIGLPKSGKTTVFQALTKGRGEKASHHPGAAVHGVVKVPDPRLKTLTDILKPKRTVPAEVRYIDIGAPAKALGGTHLSQLSAADALIHVVRLFPDQSVPHIEGSVDPERDIATVDLELAFADLAIIERRLERLQFNLKVAKAQEREVNLREQALLQRIKSALEKDVPLREQEISRAEGELIRNYQFLSAKPLLLLLNLGEEQIPETAAIEARFRRYRGRGRDIAALCGKLEMELAQLSDAEAEEFRAALSLNGSGLEQVVALSHQLLGLVTFFTIASDEVKAWTVPQNTTAHKAAGKIHSDMERGFIRAEVIAYDELVKCGSIAEARRQGRLRLEGKSYIVQDGDVVTILFHV